MALDTQPPEEVGEVTPESAAAGGSLSPVGQQAMQDADLEDQLDNVNHAMKVQKQAETMAQLKTEAEEQELDKVRRQGSLKDRQVPAKGIEAREGDYRPNREMGG